MVGVSHGRGCAAALRQVGVSHSRTMQPIKSTAGLHERLRVGGQHTTAGRGSEGSVSPKLQGPKTAAKAHTAQADLKSFLSFGPLHRLHP